MIDVRRCFGGREVGGVAVVGEEVVHHGVGEAGGCEALTEGPLCIIASQYLSFRQTL